ncbi:Antirestriction protein [Methanosarcina barkeri 227]|uniref:Antirestriction protein n=1 Tax=Methanosarcina barkeri 227 TaxID=1434106 RepID=A0A0E3R0S0_METBA|nr:Antirestriction protein [Methanosarcina barkeri 227]
MENVNGKIVKGKRVKGKRVKGKRVKSTFIRQKTVIGSYKQYCPDS